MEGLKILGRDGKPADEEAAVEDPVEDPMIIKGSYCPIRSPRGIVPTPTRLGGMALAGQESPCPCRRDCMLYVYPLPGEAARGHCGLVGSPAGGAAAAVIASSRT